MSWHDLRRLGGFQLASLFFGFLPRRASYVLTGLASWTVVNLFPGRLQGLRANLQQVLPQLSEADLDRVVARNARNYGRFWVDLFRVPRLSLRARRRLLRIEGEEHLRRILAEGRGCLAVSIHMGAWEGCAAFWAKQDAGTALIAEVLRPPALWHRLRRLRQSNGLDLIPLGRTAPREILRRLKGNGIVAGAMDRDILGSGRPYQFFGRTAYIPTGMVDVAQRTGAGILPVVCLRDPGDRYRAVGSEPIWVGDGPAAVDEAVRALIAIFENWIRAYPEQWHVMEPLWEVQARAEEPPVAEVSAVG